MRHATLCFGALALGLSAIGASTAQAHEGPGPMIERFDEEFTVEEDEFLTDICGFLVQVDVDVQGTVRFWPDGSIHVTEQGSAVLSNPDSGKTLTNWWRRNFRGQSSETIDEDGILTVRFDDTFTGIPERWLDDDGKTLIMDRGFANFSGQFTIDLGDDPEDPDDDVFLGFEEEITLHGPHPILENGLDPFEACVRLS